MDVPIQRNAVTVSGNSVSGHPLKRKKNVMLNAIGTLSASYGFSSAASAKTAAGTFDASNSPNTKAVGRTSSPSECQTCKNRKYQDGSDEMVSFKAAAHIDPGSAGALVRSHEQEHVSNAYKDAALKDGKVLSATVSIRTAICPECGRAYVSGGTTRTRIRYPNESNPYARQNRQINGMNLKGSFIDASL